MTDNADLLALVREIADHPKPGIAFRDISTLLLDGAAFRTTIDRMAELLNGTQPCMLAGIEARGFIFASALAYRMGWGMIMLRKPGKLPGTRLSIEYELAYGSDTLEMHDDACVPDTPVVLVDDLLATGGTALAAARLLRDAGARVEQALFAIDLVDLGGGDRLREENIAVRSLINIG